VLLLFRLDSVSKITTEPPYGDELLGFKKIEVEVSIFGFNFLGGGYSTG
jgi:hypothetical protein